MKTTIKYKKNTCGGCLNWKADDIIGITGHCCHPEVNYDGIVFNSEDTCRDWKSMCYRENTYINLITI